MSLRTKKIKSHKKSDPKAGSLFFMVYIYLLAEKSEAKHIQVNKLTVTKILRLVIIFIN